jgi:hypothetical protein
MRDSMTRQLPRYDDDEKYKNDKIEKNEQSKYSGYK